MSVFPSAALASPLVVPVGTVQAVLALTPDPPQTGHVSADHSLRGVSPEALSRTNASFSSSMPAMSMAGPSGVARLL